MSSGEVFPNPLVKQVIFAIRFPNLFFLADRIGDFQIKVMKEFPKSTLVLRRSLVLTDEADTQKFEQMVSDLKEKEGVNRVWQFESEHGVKLEVSSDLLALVSTSHKSYRHGEEGCFRDVIDSVTRLFYALTQVPVVNRIGLRYIDECPVFENSSKGFREHYMTVFPLDRFPLEESVDMDYRVVVRREAHKLRYVESLHGHDMISDEFNRTIKEPIREYMRKPVEQSHAS